MAKTKTSGAKSAPASLTEITPVRRRDYFLQDIADGAAIATKTPVTREEEFLRRIAKKQADQDAAIESSGGGEIAQVCYMAKKFASNGTISGLNVPESTVGAELCAKIRSDMEDLDFAHKVLYMLEHMEFYANGCRALPITSDGVTATPLHYTRIPIVATVSGSETVITGDFSVQLNLTGSLFLTCSLQPQNISGQFLSGITDSTIIRFTYIFK